MIRCLQAAWVCGFAVLLALAPAAHAQRPHLSPAALGQIADEILNALAAPGQELSRVPVGKRGIVLDFARTMDAFAAVGTSAANFSDLRMRTPVELGTRELLDGCTPYRRQNACTGLGWRAYAWIQPVSVTGSEVVVRAALMWPDRGGAAFEPGVVPEGGASLVGFSVDVHLARTPGGDWKVTKQGIYGVG